MFAEGCFIEVLRTDDFLKIKCDNDRLEYDTCVQ